MATAPDTEEQPRQPFYETNLFWGCFGAGFGIVVTVVAAMIRDLRWLLLIAWPLFCVSIWAATKNISYMTTKVAVRISAWVIFAIALYALNARLIPATDQLQRLPQLTDQHPEKGQQASTPQAKPEPIQQATRQPEKIQHKLKSIPPHKLPPLIKEWAVSTVIPFNKDGMSAGIPDELNSKDPLLMTYKTLASIGRMASRHSPVADNEAEAFTSDVLIYYILRSIVELQNKDTFYTLNSATGLTTTTTSPVIVPDAKLFPEDQMDNFLIETKFGLNKDELMRVWKRYKFEMPADTIIDLYERGIGFKKEGYYELLFWFDPPLKHIGVLPINFIPPEKIDRRNIVSFAFTVSMRFKWYRDYAEAEPYKEWAQALFSGLENRLKQPPP